jgi:hypothetical protein
MYASDSPLVECHADIGKAIPGIIVLLRDDTVDLVPTIKALVPCEVMLHL